MSGMYGAIHFPVGVYRTSIRLLNPKESTGRSSYEQYRSVDSTVYLDVLASNEFLQNSKLNHENPMASYEQYRWMNSTKSALKQHVWK